MYDDMYSRRARGKSWGAVIVWGLIAMLLTAAGVNMLLAGTGVITDSSEPHGATSIGESFIWLAGAAACVLVAIHFEHRARGLPHGKIGARAEAATQGAGRRYLPVGRVRGISRREGPLSSLVSGIVFFLMSAVAVFAAFATQAEAAKSSYTQASGVATVATVTHVNNEQSCGRRSCDYYAYVTVALRAPVDGHASTVVNVPRNVSYADGQAVAVLVDPKDPGYAELPGSPYKTVGDTVGLGFGAAFLFIIGVVGIVRGIRMRRRIHAWRASDMTGSHS